MPKSDFGKFFFKWMNNSAFEKTMENVRKPSDLELVITKSRRDYLLLQPNYCTTKSFSKKLLAVEIKKQK